jgi:hypothetical protein
MKQEIKAVALLILIGLLSLTSCYDERNRVTITNAGNKMHNRSDKPNEADYLPAMQRAALELVKVHQYLTLSMLSQSELEKVTDQCRQIIKTDRGFVVLWGESGSLCPDTLTNNNSRAIHGSQIFSRTYTSEKLTHIKVESTLSLTDKKVPTQLLATITDSYSFTYDVAANATPVYKVSGTSNISAFETLGFKRQYEIGEGSLFTLNRDESQIIGLALQQIKSREISRLASTFEYDFRLIHNRAEPITFNKACGQLVPIAVLNAIFGQPRNQKITINVDTAGLTDGTRFLKWSFCEHGDKKLPETNTTNSN